MRGATIAGGLVTRCAVVSIHAPHAGRDLCYQCHNVSPLVFQSTRPMRGATIYRRIQEAAEQFQSTRPMRGATVTVAILSMTGCFNPRAPCGARPAAPSPPCRRACFNPRAPCGARQSLIPCNLLLHGFNPRAPCGARLSVIFRSSGAAAFQSTRPMRGVTAEF